MSSNYTRSGLEPYTVLTQNPINLYCNSLFEWSRCMDFSGALYNGYADQGTPYSSARNAEWWFP